MSACDLSIDTTASCDLGTIIDFLATLYEAGTNLKRAMTYTFTEREGHRYQLWRHNVLEALRNPKIPKYLMLTFMTTPDVLVAPYHQSASREAPCIKAAASPNQALAVLLDIIKELTQLKTHEAGRTNDTPPNTLPTYDLHAEMEGRRLVIHAGAHKLVSKHRLAYNGNPHKLLRSMIGHKGHELTREEAGIPANLKISDVVQGIGFKGLLHRKLLDSGTNTVTLKEGVLIDDHELRDILESCQDNFDAQ